MCEPTSYFGHKVSKYFLKVCLDLSSSLVASGVRRAKVFACVIQSFSHKSAQRMRFKVLFTKVSSPDVLIYHPVSAFLIQTNHTETILPQVTTKGGEVGCVVFLHLETSFLKHHFTWHCMQV